MRRYFFTISYNGTPYFGWQRQPKQISVQQVIEENLSKLNSLQEVNIVGCGRTDTGVHAMSYVFHVDYPEISDKNQFMYKLNKMLPESIVIHQIHEVSTESHARFDAKKRTYRYFIHQKKNAFLHNLSVHFPHELNLDLMNKAAAFLIGRQDFTSLSKLHTDVKTNICEVTEAQFFPQDEQLVFEISADRFLRNMVRATVGTLLDVGTGKLNAEEVRTILDAKNRQEASKSVPAHGLYLWEIEY